MLKVANRYGNLCLTSWNENRIVIEVHVKVNGDSEDRVQKKLNEIQVEFEASRSMVAAKTIFSSEKGWRWSWGGKGNVNMEINYTIKLPVTNQVDLSNDYGGITLDRLKGKARISCDYGRLNLGELLADYNELSFDYTSKASIGFMKNGKINADYSGFELEKTEKLELNADYTQSKINTVGFINYSCDYGGVNIGDVHNIEGNGDYVTAKFGTVHGKLTISSDYGSISVNELAADAGNVQIQSDYTGIKLGYHPNYSFDFDIKLGYAHLKNADDFEFTVKRENYQEKYYRGYYGKSGKNNLSIAADYGSVTFNKTY